MENMIITGNPGVGKTKVGGIIANIYYHIGIVPEKKITIGKAGNILGDVVGETKGNTKKLIEKAMGGILIIDEAYALGEPKRRNSYARECIDEMTQAASEYKGKLIFILMGYKDPIEKYVLAHNEGLSRRFPIRYNIEDYSTKDLLSILQDMIKDEKLAILTEQQDEFCDNFIDLLNNNPQASKDQGGAMENIMSRAVEIQSQRCFGKHPKERKYIRWEDLERAVLVVYPKKKKFELNDSTRMMYA